MEEQLEFEGLTAELPQGGTLNSDCDRLQSGKEVLPKGSAEEREALCALTMEEVSTYDNLKLAFLKVKANKGAPGIDKKSVQEVGADIENVIRRLTVELLAGSYEPSDIRRVWIPKPGGGERGLGIPTVIDRIVQQALHQVMSPVFDKDFHPSSHGFRPGKGCHTAIAEAIEHLEEGNEWVVDIDLEKFFDQVNQDRLLSRLERSISDKRILKLIRRMLKAKTVMPDGVVVETEMGVPQGGPLSPLLSNIVLDELDKELSIRGHRFVRYADDCNIYVQSERAGQRVMESTSRFITKRLKLKVNATKSAVAKPSERHFLGFRMERDPLDGKVSTRLSKRSKDRVAQKVKEHTPRNFGQSFSKCIERLNQYLKGWLAYFRIISEEEVWQLHTLDAHIRRRLRAILLRQWKRKRYIVRKLIHLGVKPKLAWQSIYRKRRSWWAMSHCKAVDKGLCNAYLADQGLYSTEVGWRSFSLKALVTVPVQLSLDLG